MADPADQWGDVGPLKIFKSVSRSHPVAVQWGEDDGYVLTIDDAKDLVSRVNALLAKIGFAEQEVSA